jgi:ABC-type transport system involved in cytochrome c biogenesis permease subunit
MEYIVGNHKENKSRRSAEPIQRSDLAIVIIVIFSLVCLTCVMIFAKYERPMVSFVLAIIGGVCLLGVFYLVTRFSSMYLTFQGIQGHKLIFGIILIVVVLVLSLAGGLDKYQYYSIASAFIGFIAGLGFSKYIFPS